MNPLLDLMGMFEAYGDRPRAIIDREDACKLLQVAIDREKRLVKSLTWAIDVIDHEVEPPKSCGACGNPNATCDGDCATATYFSIDMHAARDAIGTIARVKATARPPRIPILPPPDDPEDMEIV